MLGISRNGLTGQPQRTAQGDWRRLNFHRAARIRAMPKPNRMPSQPTLPWIQLCQLHPHRPPRCIPGINAKPGSKSRFHAP